MSTLSSSLLSHTVYGYDNASRLQTVTDGNGDSANYSYLANSPLVGQIAFANGTASMTTGKQYDYLNRLTQISSQSSASIPAMAFNYSYNSANQRTKDKLADGIYWVYKYDALGQVTSGHKYFRDNTLVPGQEFDYTFDTIGNRKQTKVGGDQNGANQRLASYTVNSLNQITSRNYPGTNDVIGVALATNTALVNGQTAWRKGEYFWATVSTNNTSSAEWEQVTVASGGYSSVGGLYVAQTPESFTYDLDGNLLSDGRWNYKWDAENRLVAMTNNTGVGPLYGLAFVYDSKGRRIEKLVVTNNGSAYVGQYTNRFVYDGWNPVAILIPQSSIIESCTWGSDLSGSQQGAGGVGGLLAVHYVGTANTNCFVVYDGNGNVAGLINAAGGTLAASYEYGPFGEVIRSTGPMAKANPIRFSTKYQDDESDLLYYGYRYYKASTGAWLSRDPIGEPGGANLYEFVLNSAVNVIDRRGLQGFLPPYGWWPPQGPKTCKSCKCKKVKFDPVDPTPTVSVEQGITTGNQGQRTLRIGPRFNYTIEVEGDPSLCTCTYNDNGSIVYNDALEVQGYPTSTASGTAKFPNVTHPTHGGCVSGYDQPGFENPIGPRAGTGTATLTYDLTVTVTCTDGEGSMSDSAKLSGGPYTGPVNWSAAGH